MFDGCLRKLEPHMLKKEIKLLIITVLYDPETSLNNTLEYYSRYSDAIKRSDN